MENNDIICFKRSDLKRNIKVIEKEIEDYEDVDEMNLACLESELSVLKSLMLIGFSGKEIFKESRKIITRNGSELPEHNFSNDYLDMKEYLKYEDYKDYLKSLDK